MSANLGTYYLYSPKHDKDLAVELMSGIDALHLEKIEKDWKPILLQQAYLVHSRYKQMEGGSELDFQNLLQEYGVPDYHWKWEEKVSQVVSRTTHATFCIEADSKVQSAMLVDLTRRCRDPNSLGDHLVYVDFLSVAPWNRSQIQNPPLLKGLGKMMLAVAVSLSFEEDWNGKIGLHSLPQSEGFYSSCGMEDYGSDSQYNDLHYFEFTSAKAEAFLE